MITRSGEAWHPTADQVAAWTALHPALDVPWELAQMAAWLDANPPRRKTARGMSRFCLAWLKRSAALPSGPARISPPQMPWTCRHLERCGHRAMCAIKELLPAKYPQRGEKA
jgi:hypothetical protein